MSSLPPANQLPAAAKRDGRSAQSGAVAAQFGVPARPILGFDHGLTLSSRTRRPLSGLEVRSLKSRNLRLFCADFAEFSAASPCDQCTRLVVAADPRRRAPSERQRSAARHQTCPSLQYVARGYVFSAHAQVHRSTAGSSRGQAALSLLSDSDNAPGDPARYRYRRHAITESPRKAALDRRAARPWRAVAQAALAFMGAGYPLRSPSVRWWGPTSFQARHWAARWGREAWPSTSRRRHSTRGTERDTPLMGKEASARCRAGLSVFVVAVA